MIGVSSQSEAERHAALIEALWDRYEEPALFSKRYTGLIPIRMATEGKALIAAYLYALHENSKTEVAELLSITPETVDQYLSDVISGRR